MLHGEDCQIIHLFTKISDKSQRLKVFLFQSNELRNTVIVDEEDYENKRLALSINEST